MKDHRILAALLAALLFAGGAFAAPPTLTIPKEIAGEPGTFIAIRADSNAEWVNFRADPGLAVFPSDLLSDRKATVVTARTAGRYKLFVYTGNEDGGADAECIIVIGKPGPKPDPDPEPDPDPDPITVGKRSLLLIRESTKDTPELSGLIVGLRNGAPAEYLKSKGHRLFLLDDNDKDMNGRPTALVEKWRAQLAGINLPAIVVLDSANRLLHKQELPAAATPDAVLAILKAHGG